MTRTAKHFAGPLLGELRHEGLYRSVLEIARTPVHDLGDGGRIDLTKLELEPLDDQIDLVAQLGTGPHVLRGHDYRAATGRRALS